MKKGNLFAFTLAEVLITLTILGVIAAITVPSLIERNNQKQYITRYRKTVAALNEAYELYKIEVDPAGLVAKNSRHSWQNSSINDEFLKKYLAGVKDTTWATNYTDYADYNNHKGIKFLNGTSVSQGIPRVRFLRLKDGVEIRVNDPHPHWAKSSDPKEQTACLGTSTTNCGVAVGMVMIDVNGEKKGPNVIGKDIYFGWLFISGYYTLPLPSRYNSIYTDDLLRTRSKLSEKCTKTSTGMNCSSWFLTHNDYDK